ncbi:hypothetical protein V8D89_008231 [Ganoderma adspersum]
MTPQPCGLDLRHAYELIKDHARQGRLNMPRGTAELKNFAAAPDDFRCMVSRVGDYFAMQGGIIEVEDHEPREPGRMWWAVAECCHIFPEALEVVPEDSHCWRLNVAENHAETFWAILGRFGYGHIHDELKGTKIHRLENVMTLAGIRALFRGLDVWFEEDHDADGQAHANSYRVGARFDPPVPERIQFVASAANFPLPDPTYLRVHAACCRINHLSGAWRHLQVESLFWEEARAHAFDANGPLPSPISLAISVLVHTPIFD